MKNCPKCRMETRPDAEWCWHCGYAYEDGSAASEKTPCEPPATSTLDGDDGER